MYLGLKENFKSLEKSIVQIIISLYFFIFTPFIGLDFFIFHAIIGLDFLIFWQFIGLDFLTLQKKQVYVHSS